MVVVFGQESKGNRKLGEPGYLMVRFHPTTNILKPMNLFYYITGLFTGGFAGYWIFVIRAEMKEKKTPVRNRIGFNTDSYCTTAEKKNTPEK